MSMKKKDLTLRYDDASATDMLVNESGDAVWPIRSDVERKHLERMAETYGATMVASPGTQGATRTATGTVVALGADVTSEARLYGHLTCRSVQVATDLRHLQTLPLPEIVVTTTARVTADLLQHLYCRTSESAPGIVSAETLDKLRIQVLTRSAAAAVCGEDGGTAVEIDCGVSINGRSWQDYSGDELSTELKRQLTEGAPLITLTTHSDGLHTFLTSDLALCNIQEEPAVADGHSPPRCVLTGHCHLQNTTVEQVTASGGILAPRDIRGQIIIMNTCWGIVPDDGALGLNWGVGRGLMEHDSAGAIMTTWIISTTNARQSDGLTRALLRGQPAGRALARLNSSGKWRRMGLRMCLIGDPRVRLRPQQSEPPDGRSPVRKRSLFERRTQIGAIGQAAFLRGLLMQAVSGSAAMVRHFGEQIVVSSTSALQAVLAFEKTACEGGAVELPESGLGSQLRRTLLTYILCRGKVEQDWTPLVRRILPDSNDADCFLCGSAAVSLLYKFWTPGVAARRVTSCPCCGIVEDSPADVRMTYRWSGDRSIQLAGDLPERKWSVGVRISSQLPVEHYQNSWHDDQNSQFPGMLPLDDSNLVGPLRLIVAIAWDGQFVTLGQCLPAADDSRQIAGSDSTVAF